MSELSAEGVVEQKDDLGNSVLLGQGNFGRVFKGVLRLAGRSDIDVGIKKLLNNQFGELGKEASLAWFV